MRKIWILLLFLTLVIVEPSSAITIVKSVGHGDCYVVISDGRIVLVDAGSAKSADSLISLLKSGYLHYDRIVITHVHSDHVSGLITAQQYMSQTGASISTDMLVSNHGEHDLDLIVREKNIQSLLRAMRKQKSIVALNDEALQKLSLNDPNMAVEGIILPSTAYQKSENKSGLILKITELRDGEKHAVLFLGDIEKSQQRELFTHPQSDAIFRDVGAVTIPHHGRITTLSPDFFSELKKVAGSNIIALHSDSTPLNEQVSKWAADAEVKILSTAERISHRSPNDIIVNLFNEKSYHTVQNKATTIRNLVISKKHSFPLVTSGEVSADEMISAISEYSKRRPTAQLPPGTIISVPTEAWVKGHANEKREAFRKESDELISKLQSEDEREVKKASKLLTARVSKLNSNQIDQIVKA
jgi:beta-lactamase superfamily II metal-dependent hydrolase